MAVCKRIRITKNKICTGDLDKYITIQTRSLSSNSPGSYKPVEVFTDIKSVWAEIETIKGKKIFSQVNIGKQSTDLFYVFYDSDLIGLENGNNFILYNSQRYKIVSIYNDNQNNEFLLIETENTGSVTKDGATA